MKIQLTRPWVKALSGLFINMSAAWYATVFIGAIITEVGDIWILITNLFFGTMCLVVSVRLEEILENE
ncbi:hypothetical protein A3F62_02390 [Candidatus Woesebacteria bacterium RIFCSPHIGHO2_12_FULL_44_11]|uniref:Uncharacterized protein n=1 Tax=Candidatus Woesebacteria bacterium RIFCSPLOWO2_01_FULL_44_14 TaxID=1802525 RepID=A0A1F8C439_9BACT|nr:MAG: hypothetical protein A3F62_02390 [Candidatus Woesebacteria bacterium RIFCSPHIGHO2_12_FULL_44_11]OGM70910.1 MAG: hypothetical protein A2975_01380 [Candidatus Woesebacteria bacterium RIFCSPLOWO2_01_FULL_44_14]